MQQHDWSSVNPKGPMLHLSLSSCTGSRLQLASSSRNGCLQNSHRLSTCLLPLTYDNLHPLKKFEICERASPRGAITERHKITFQNVFIHRSWGVEWNPTPLRNAESLTISSATWKLTSSVITWLHLKKKTLLSFLNLALFPLTSHCLARICSEQCLEICITSTSCVCLPLYNVLLYCIPNE